jgi:hypothetical protein
MIINYNHTDTGIIWTDKFTFWSKRYRETKTDGRLGFFWTQLVSLQAQIKTTNNKTRLKVVARMLYWQNFLRLPRITVYQQFLSCFCCKFSRKVVVLLFLVFKYASIYIHLPFYQKARFQSTVLRHRWVGICMVWRDWATRWIFLACKIK